MYFSVSTSHFFMRESHTFYRALAVSIAAVSILAWSKPTSAKSISFYELQAGVATFKDVQLPYWGEFFGDPTTRADGSSIQEDNGSHVGFPIKGSATYRWHQGLYGVDGVANFMFVKHLIGDEQSSFASFQNASLSVRPFYKFRLLSYSTKAGGILKLNRNDYLNVSSGHTLTGVMAGSFIQAGSLRKVRLEGEFLYDVFPSFSFRKSGNYFDLDELANTNVDHYNLKVSGSKYLGNQVIGILGYEYDAASVSIDDVRKYSEFGLSISPYQDLSRSYLLDSHIFTLGLRKLF